MKSEHHGEGSSDDISGVRESGSRMQPQNAFADNGLHYFETSAAPQGRPVIATREASHPHHHVNKPSETGSPPPNSATTSGSTSTPTSPSTGGLSSSADCLIKHSEAVTPAVFPPRTIDEGSSTTNFGNIGHNPYAGQNWAVAIPEGAMHQNHPSPGPVAPVVDEQNQLPAPGSMYDPNSHSSAIKLLVSNNVAGSIIGRGGQTISDLQTQSSARIKLSQAGDFYPGTQDRVCLVQGQSEHVKLAVRLLLERFYMLQEQHHLQHAAWQSKESNEIEPSRFDFIVRLLVPSPSCGMIIGKGGSNIKHMEDASGITSVRLSPKEGPEVPASAVGGSGTAERIVTLIGPSMDSCLLCMHIILDAMMAHQDVSRYSNMTTSYTRVIMEGPYGGLPPPVSVPGRPVLVVPGGPGTDPSGWESALRYESDFGIAKRSSSSPDLSGHVMWEPTGAPRMPTESTETPMPRPPSQNDPAPSYNLLFAEGGPQSFSQEVPPPMMSSPGRGPLPGLNPPPPMYLLPPPVPSANQVDQGAMHNSVSAPDLLALQMQDSLRIGASSPANGPDYNHFAPQLPQPSPPGFSAQVLVPDTLIGSILGRGGRTLNELQMHSNTRIRISQRGEYVPGTRNRIVTIRGPTAHSVSLAQYLMSQRMVLPPTAAYSIFHQPPIQPQSQHLPPSPSHLPPHPNMAPRHDLQPSPFANSPAEAQNQPTDPQQGQHTPS